MTQPDLPLSNQAVQRLTLDTEPFLSCDDCFHLVDRYVEALLSDPVHERPDPSGMRTHLAGCAACAEEARSLIGFVAQQDGTDPGPALRRLEDDRV
jgi:hypothetical protein